MQRISVVNLRPGMTIARNVFSADGRLLLREGKILTKNFIDRLREMNIASVYITATYGEDIVIPEAVNEETRLQANQTVQKAFTKFRFTNSIDFAEIRSTAISIVESILLNRSTMVHLTDIRTYDDYTFGHSVNVSILSVFTGAGLGFNRKQLEELAVGGLLHDLGKIAIPREILNKPGKLTDAEMNIMREHSLTGFEILRKQNPDIPLLAAHIAFQHHERFDGSGYPRGLAGENIHPYARIAAIADVYDALVSDRPYRRGMLPHEACDILMASAGRHFDTDFLREFSRHVAFYPIGSFVSLNSGEIGIVVHVPPEMPMRPTVRLLTNNKGILLTDKPEVDLTIHRSVMISKVLSEEEVLNLYGQLGVQELDAAQNY